MPTVLEIIEESLVANGYDGLYNADFKCSCEIGNLEPCWKVHSSCCAGYAHYDNGTCCWYIREEKPT